MAYATSSTSDDLTGVVQRALAESDAHSTTRATNTLFHLITGVDPYRLTDILVHDAPIATDITAKALRDSLAALLGTRRGEAGALLGVSESRISRNDKIDRDMLDRTHAIVDTYMNVATVLGPENAQVWLCTPHAVLDNEAPARLLTTSYGRNLVRDLIGALHAGSYV